MGNHSSAIAEARERYHESKVKLIQAQKRCMRAHLILGVITELDLHVPRDLKIIIMQLWDA